MLKFITIKHIDYENGVINNIEGFTFSENYFHFDKCIDQGTLTSNIIEYNKVKISLLDIWLKMVDILCKSIYNKLLFK
jgi:hypothetical protein